MARRFEDKTLVHRYSKYRPTYPDIVYKTIIDYIGDNCDLNIAVDVGCGGGQGTLPLAKYFHRVIGTDVSVEMISEAKPKENDVISFKVCPAEDLGFLSGESVDLVTAASSLQWVKRDEFFKEATRVLKPGGCLAAFGYAIPTLCNQQANNLYLQESIAEFRDEYVFNGEKMCRDVNLPFPEQSRFEGNGFTLEKEMLLSDYIGLLSTSSSWGRHVDKYPHSTVLGTLKERLLDIYKGDEEGDDPSVFLSWPFYLMIGRKQKYSK